MTDKFNLETKGALQALRQQQRIRKRLIAIIPGLAICTLVSIVFGITAFFLREKPSTLLLDGRGHVHTPTIIKG